MDSSSNDESESINPTLPMLEICVEYKSEEESFNFYIKQIINCPLTPSFTYLRAKVNIYIAKGMTRTTWMGRQKNISWQEMQTRNAEKFSTLSVTRSSTTICNEFFTSKVPLQQLHYTAMRIALCDVNKDGDEVEVAECYHWIDAFCLHQFVLCSSSMNACSPDIGELHLAISHQPTVQRLVVANIKCTNLRINNQEEFYVRGLLIISKNEHEAHKTEVQSWNGQEQEEEGIQFDKRLIFDLPKNKAPMANLLLQVVKILDGKKQVCGCVCLGKSDIGHWMRILLEPRYYHFQIYRLHPSL